MVKSNLRWAGGKSKMTNILQKYFPQTINKYFEVFVGGGSVLLYVIQKYRPYHIYANDINTNLINYYTSVKNNEEELIKELKDIKNKYNSLSFKDKFNDYNEKEAYAFFLKNKTSFSGLFNNYSSLAYDRNFTISSIEQIKDISDVIQQVNFINKNFEDIDMDLSDYFIYLDPPYYSNKNVGLYGEKGNLHKYFNHQSLKNFVDYYSIDNKIAISYDDCNFVRDLYKDYYIYNFDFTYSMTNVGGNNCKIGKELIITNYEIKQQETNYEDIKLF